MKRRTVLSMIREQRGQAALWVLLSAGIGFFAPLKSFILQWIIDSKTVEHALMCLLAGVAITAASHGFELSCRSAFTKLVCGAMDGIRRRVMKGVLARPMEQGQREEDAAYLSALTTDMRTLYDECFTPLFNIVFWGAILLCAIGMYLFVSPALLLIVAVMSVPPLVLPRLLNRRLARARGAFSGEMARYTQRVKETLAGFETIRLFGCEARYEAAHEDASAQNAASERRVQQSVNETIVASSLLANGTFIVILFFGMLQVFSGKISMGYMVTASQLANFIIQPCQYISQNVARLRSTKGIRTRMEALMEERTAQAEGGTCLPQDGSVVCEGVTFVYPDTDRRVLDGLTLAVGDREKTALVGVSGCGKSTLAKLLCRYYGTYAGSIRVGGAELSGIPREALLRHVGYISQRTFLFDDTIRHNISLYEPFTQEQMDEAVRLSGLAAYIASLPERLDTRIAENGRNLSGGQAQRIGIARAAIRGYRVILADEITASLDEATSQQVMDNLLNMDATVIAITHDTQGEFMKRFDSVYRMEDGKAKRQAHHTSGLCAHLTEDSEGFSLNNRPSLL